jgi:hypothetical protein
VQGHAKQLNEDDMASLSFVLSVLHLDPGLQLSMHTHTHTHTHIYIHT